MTGTSFGAYHAVNFSLRHPSLVTQLVALSGRYDIKGFDETYLVPMRRMRIVLLTGEHDIALQSTRFISETLTAKGVENELAIWWGYNHDWPLLREAIPYYL